MVSKCIGRLYNRNGIFYVSGNHEHINGDVSHWLEELKKHHVHVLDNDCFSLVDFNVDIIGITDLSADRFGGEFKADPNKAVAACKGKGRKKIVLAHQPNHHRAITKSLGNDEYLLLSGHVHGGQIWPASIVVSWFNDFFKGYYKAGRMQVFVGRGTGQWGPRLRLSSRAELVQIRIN